MQRRDFLVASAASVATVVSTDRVVAAADAPSARQLIELRIFHFATPQKRQAFERFLGEAGIPAFARAGVRPAGAFKLMAKDNPDLKLDADPNDLYLVLPHASAESLLTLRARLAADEAYQSAGRAVIAAAKSDPAYTRYESSLLLGFDECPTVGAPSKAASRVVQLRIYESHNEERAKQKIRMFNEGGEIAIFRRVGLNPVFFGQALVGSKLPNLTYMVGFDDDKAREAAWNAFRADPEWKKLSGDPAYKDTVSNITNLVLRPVDGSQI